MPDLIRFYRDHRDDGLRLVLVSADDEENRAEVARVLAEAGLPADALSLIKRGDDMKFINGLDRHWSARCRHRSCSTGAAASAARGLARSPIARSSSAPPVCWRRRRPRPQTWKEKAMTFAPFVLATTLSLAGVLPIGKPAPESHTKMKNAVDGKLLSIADVTGKAGTLVIFTCDHCPFARGWEGRIVELGNAYAKKGVGVILINANDPSEHEEDGFAGMQARAKSANMQVPYVVDETSNVARAFGATVTPEVVPVRLSRQARLSRRRRRQPQGRGPGAKALPADALDAVVSGKPPARTGDQEPRLQHQVPPVVVARA